MKQVMLNLSVAENVRMFVNTVSKYSFNMNLRSGRYVVDAKSILGIFSLNLGNPITLEIDDRDALPEQVEALLNEIQPFVVE